MGRFAKFVRPEQPRRGQISERDPNILDVVLRDRFLSAAQIVRLVPGNEDVTHRRLRLLWEWGLISRWAFPGIRTHSEFYYYLDSREALDLLAEQRGLEIHPQMVAELKHNRDKDYAAAAVRFQPIQLGFLQHSLMVSRFHFTLETGAARLGSQITLAQWAQGSQLSGNKVEVPKVSTSRRNGEYFWEADPTKTEQLPVEPDGMFTLRVMREGIKLK